MYIPRPSWEAASWILLWVTRWFFTVDCSVWLFPSISYSVLLFTAKLTLVKMYTICWIWSLQRACSGSSRSFGLVEHTLFHLQKHVCINKDYPAVTLIKTLINYLNLLRPQFMIYDLRHLGMRMKGLFQFKCNCLIVGKIPIQPCWQIRAAGLRDECLCQQSCMFPGYQARMPLPSP